jgi:uncharacterized membrane protein YphA (DoxX/SURF4 family)
LSVTDVVWILRTTRGRGVGFALSFEYVIPPLEVGAALLLLVGLGTKWTALIISLLLSVFTVAVATNLSRGRRIRCGCIGTVSERQISWSAVVRNLAMIALCAVIFVWTPMVLAVDGIAASSLDRIHPKDGAALLLVGVLAPFLMSIVDQTLRAWSHRNAMAVSSATRRRI